MRITQRSNPATGRVFNPAKYLKYAGRWLAGLGVLAGLSGCPAPGAPLEAGRCRCMQDCPNNQQCLHYTETSTETLTSECLPLSDRAGHCAASSAP